MYEYDIDFVVWDWLTVSDDIDMSLCLFLRAYATFIIRVRFPKIVLWTVFLVEHPIAIKHLNVFHKEAP